jgi:hypothetical protein
VNTIRISYWRTYIYVGHPITIRRQQQRNKSSNWSWLTVLICPPLLTQEACLWKIWKRQWDTKQGSKPITHCLFIKYHYNTSMCLYVIYEEAVNGMLSPTPTCFIISYVNISHWHPFNLRLLSKERDWGKKQGLPA